MIFRVLLLLLILAGNVDAAEIDGMQMFWREFRQAILDGNCDKAASMTKFPLWVRGPDDSDPIIYYDKKSFPPILKRLLDQEVLSLSGGRVNSKTMRQLIREKQAIAGSDFLAENVVDVEQFEFEQINGRWFFTRAYLED